jgi:hypothetical protein
MTPVLTPAPAITLAQKYIELPPREWYCRGECEHCTGNINTDNNHDNLYKIGELLLCAKHYIMEARKQLKYD